MSVTLTGRVPQLCPALGAPRRSRAPAEAAGDARTPGRRPVDVQTLSGQRLCGASLCRCQRSRGRRAPVPVRRPSSGFDCRLALIQGPGLSRIPSCGALGPLRRSRGLESPVFSVGSPELFLGISF